MPGSSHGIANGVGFFFFFFVRGSGGAIAVAVSFEGRGHRESIAEPAPLGPIIELRKTAAKVCRGLSLCSVVACPEFVCDLRTLFGGKVKVEVPPYGPSYGYPMRLYRALCCSGVKVEVPLLLQCPVTILVTSASWVAVSRG